MGDHFGLAPLRDNGGPTFTHALLRGSPAIDGGNVSGCWGTDQRGITRPVDGDGDGDARCDIGAYEYRPSVATIEPGLSGTLISDDGSVGLELPAGAVDNTTTLTVTTDITTTRPHDGLVLASRAFGVVAAHSAGEVSNFNQPFTLTLTYADADWQDVGLHIESGLNLYGWDGSEWVGLLPCQGCSHDQEENKLVAVLDHLSEFALMADEEVKVYLPIAIKNQ